MKPGDQVLITRWRVGLPVRDWAKAVEPGLIVALGDEASVRAARREFADLDNVMFTLGSRDDIPWRNGFFSLILDDCPASPTPEMLRALHENGTVSIFPFSGGLA